MGVHVTGSTHKSLYGAGIGTKRRITRDADSDAFETSRPDLLTSVGGFY